MKICAECHAVFDGRKWSGNHGLTKKKISELESTLCTACKRVRDKVALGTAYLDGEVIALQPNEVLRMIRREEEIERVRNYSSRILDIERSGSKMTVKTVNTQLAIYIAQQCRKAFKGKIEIFKDTPGHRPRNKQTEGTVAVKWTQNP